MTWRRSGGRSQPPGHGGHTGRPPLAAQEEGGQGAGGEGAEGGPRLQHLELSQQPGHIRVGRAVGRLAVDVVAKVGVGHDKDGDVGEAADISELSQLVLDGARVDTNLQCNTSCLTL